MHEGKGTLSHCQIALTYTEFLLCVSIKQAMNGGLSQYCKYLALDSMDITSQKMILVHFTFLKSNKLVKYYY